MTIGRDSQLQNYGSSLWWRVPLIGTILALPAILRHDSSLCELSANGLPLGLVPSAEYVETQVSLLPGDRIILYPQAAVEEILSAARDFSGPVEQVDDVTLLVIQAQRSQR